MFYYTHSLKAESLTVMAVWDNLPTISLLHCSRSISLPSRSMLTMPARPFEDRWITGETCGLICVNGCLFFCQVESPLTWGMLEAHTDGQMYTQTSLSVSLRLHCSLGATLLKMPHPSIAPIIWFTQLIRVDQRAWHIAANCFFSWNRNKE